MQSQKVQLEKYQSENQILRSINEREKNDAHLFIDQLKLKQDIELNILRRERDLLNSKLQENNQTDIDKIREALRENNQLSIKVKALIEENEEIREKLERAESQNNMITRNHSKTLSEYSTKISVLEVKFTIFYLKNRALSGEIAKSTINSINKIPYKIK